MRYRSGGGQSQGDTCVCNGRNWLRSAPFYRDCRYFLQKKKGLAQKPVDLFVAIPAPQHRVCMQTRNSCGGRQSGAVTPSLCVTPSCSPPSLRATAGSHELCQQVLSSTFWQHGWTGYEFTSVQHPAKNISHVPIEHCFLNLVSPWCENQPVSSRHSPRSQAEAVL